MWQQQQCRAEGGKSIGMQPSISVAPTQQHYKQIYISLYWRHRQDDPQWRIGTVLVQKNKPAVLLSKPELHVIVIKIRICFKLVEGHE